MTNVDGVRQYDRDRKKTARDNETEEEEVVRKEKARINSAKYRERRAIAKAALHPAVYALGSYQCRQTLGKAMKKVTQALPESPTKRGAVIAHLLKLNNISPAAAVQTAIPKIPWNKSSDAMKEAVVALYDSDDVSWTSPNLRDCAKIPGSTERICRKYLTCVLREAHGIYQEKHPTLNCGFSTFVSLRPQHIKLLHNLPEVTCLCRYHENFRFLVIALKPVLLYDANWTTKDFLRKCVCNLDDERCMYNECGQCSGNLQAWRDELVQNFDLDVLAPQYFQWETTAAEVKKATINDDTLNDVLDRIATSINAFKTHCFVKWRQFESFETARSNLAPHQCVCQVDFAENHRCDVQDEIQAHHFKGGPQITLFTACAWWNGVRLAMTGVSDSLEHSKYSVFHLLRKIIAHVLSVSSSVTEFCFYR